MPVVEVHLIAGYDDEAKRRLGAALTDAVRSVVPATLEGTTVLMHEMTPSGYMRGRTARDPAPALPDPAATVRAFLETMERRDLDAARGFLAEGFEMTFPGGVTMHRLEELVAWSKPRYARVAKSYERFEVAPGPEATVVWCFGTLHGEWLDGTAFDGIRFVDRFELVGGKLTRQDVWNDMGEVRSRG